MDPGHALPGYPRISVGPLDLFRPHRPDRRQHRIDDPVHMAGDRRQGPHGAAFRPGKAQALESPPHVDLDPIELPGLRAWSTSTRTAAVAIPLVRLIQPGANAGEAVGQSPFGTQSRRRLRHLHKCKRMPSLSHIWRWDLRMKARVSPKVWPAAQGQPAGQDRCREDSHSCSRRMAFTPASEKNDQGDRQQAETGARDDPATVCPLEGDDLCPVETPPARLNTRSALPAPHAPISSSPLLADAWDESD